MSTYIFCNHQCTPMFNQNNLYRKTITIGQRVYVRRETTVNRSEDSQDFTKKITLPQSQRFIRHMGTGAESCQIKKKKIVQIPGGQFCSISQIKTSQTSAILVLCSYLQIYSQIYKICNTYKRKILERTFMFTNKGLLWLDVIAQAVILKLRGISSRSIWAT